MFILEYTRQLSGDTMLYLLHEWGYYGREKKVLATTYAAKECIWIFGELFTVWTDEWFKVAVHRHLIDEHYEGFNHDGNFLPSTRLRSFPLHLVNTSEVNSYVNSTYGIFRKEGGRFPSLIYGYYMDEEEGFGDDGFEMYERLTGDIRCSEEYEEMSRHLHRLFAKALYDHASKVIRNVANVRMSMCADLLLSPMEEINVEGLRHRYKQRFDKCIVMRIMYCYVPFDETIAFIRCIQPRITKRPVLTNALDGVFREHFLTTLLPVLTL